MRARAVLSALATGVIAAGLVGVPASCARTGLEVPAAARDASHDGAPDVAHEAAPEAAVEAGPDVTDGSACESGADCPSADSCTVGTCDPALGCVFAPRDCDDGVACTTDACDDTAKACTHVPTDATCPSDQLCSATRGCASFVYGVASDGNLYEVGIPGGDLVDVGPTPASVTDIALAPDGTLYGTDTYVLYATDRARATTTVVGSIMPLHMYGGLGANPSGVLEATCDVPTLFTIDTTTAAATGVGFLPTGFRASGDITAAPIGGQPGVPWLLTMTSSTQPTTDTLAYQRPSADAIPIGDTGVTCVWGLATLGARVYGLTCQGLLVSLDTTTGKATQLAQLTPAFFGAAGR